MKSGQLIRELDLTAPEARRLAKAAGVEVPPQAAGYVVEERIARSLGQQHGPAVSTSVLIEALTGEQLARFARAFRWIGQTTEYEISSASFRDLSANERRRLCVALHEADEKDPAAIDAFCRSSEWRSCFAASPMEEAFEPYDENESEPEEEDYGAAPYLEEFSKEMAYSAEEASRKLEEFQLEAKKSLLSSLRRKPGTPVILHLATGGGKTFTGNTIAREWRQAAQGARRPVLWITKDWRLLKQAARDIAVRTRRPPLAVPPHLYRLGGDDSPLQPLREARDSNDYAEAEFIYSTIQTLTRRQQVDGILSRIRPCLVVWDECHWGEHGKAKRILQSCARMQPPVPVMGLTATPRVESRYEVASGSKTFKELVDIKWLASPRVINVNTGVLWNPQFAAAEVTRASLRELALNDSRNAQIVSEYVGRQAHYGKTIMFVCGITHANLIAEMLTDRGVSAEPVHSGKKSAVPEAAVARFRSGTTRVLVNMDMLTHGIDVPDAETVFLCRPTASDILFAQMIGRAEPVNVNETASG